jgi:predicted  nucleic acid-binding Zn-ribbon protein
MGVLEETKVIQVINRIEDIRHLLNEVGNRDNRYSKTFSQMNETLEKFEAELAEIRRAMNVENLGVKTQKPDLHAKSLEVKKKEA